MFYYQAMEMRQLALLTVLAIGATCAIADCAKDLRGDVFCGGGRCVTDEAGIVWCARHDRGDALLTLNGEALCGVGQCARTPRGAIFCSSEIGGAAMLDARGNVRCYGRCEPATANQCENTPADSAGG
jgi:photosystem II stability/assembly factor-like uncharacterized protein